jgi:hypothetical protein
MLETNYFLHIYAEKKNMESFIATRRIFRAQLTYYLHISV